MLQIGLLIDSWVLPRWVFQVIMGIQSSEFARVVLVMKNESPEVPPQTMFQKILSRRKELLFLLYKKTDDWKNRTSPDAFEPNDLNPLLFGVPVLNVVPLKRKYDDYFQEKDLAEIRAYDLDVALRFGFNILQGDALQIAKYGVWSYHHDDPRVIRGGPAGFWEVMEGHPTTGSVLQILTSELDNGRIIYRSLAATDTFSVRKNRNNYYWKSSAFVLRKLKDLAERGPEGLDVESNHQGLPPPAPIYKTPSNGQMLRLLSKLSKKYVVYQIQKLLYQEQWFLAFRLKEGVLALDGTFQDFTPLFPPQDRFWADPFPLKRGDRYYVFIEEYLEKQEKGHISVIEIDHQGKISPPIKVLEREYHLSYPFVFEWQGQAYMIPDSSSQRTLELYRATAFPYQWELEKTLMTGVNAVDATLAEIKGCWWMFVNIAVEGNVKNWDELYLFYSDTPLGPWRPHPRNPVKSDVRSSRPAGRLFCRKGSFFRPAQDCSLRYGYAISINEVTRITPTEYQEKEVSKVLPHWGKGVVANHTLNYLEGLTVMDGLRRRRRF